MTNEELHQLFIDCWNRAISADEAFDRVPDVQAQARIAELEELRDMYLDLCPTCLDQYRGSGFHEEVRK